MVKIEKILFLFPLTSFLGLSSGYPDLSHDYRISEADLAPLYREYITNQRELTDGMPRLCRRDICYEDVTSLYRKGEFNWPEIISGQRVQLRCPFSFKKPVYATRVCSVNPHGETFWEEPDSAEVCPDPPLAELMEKITLQMHSLYPGNYTIFYQDMLVQVIEVFTLYRDTPIDFADIQKLVNVLKEIIPHYVMSGDMLLPETAQDYLTVVDTLMDDDFRHIFSSAINSNRLGFRDDLGRIPLLTQPHNDSMRYVRNNLAVYTISITTSEDTMLNISDGFDTRVRENITVRSPIMALKFSKRLNNRDPVPTFTLGLTLLKYSEVFTSSSRWTETIVEFGDDLINGTIVNSTTTETEYFIYKFDSLGSVILLTPDSSNADFLHDLEVLYSYYTCDVTRTGSKCMTLPKACVNSKEKDIWSGTSCEVTEVLDDDGFTSCLCRGTGAFAIFLDTSSYPEFGSPGHNPGVFPKVTLPAIIEGDISAFLGFPYKKEVEILGTVLGSLSLACLIATLASYAIFRNTRKGSPTTILLNLCVALTVLSVLLLIVQYLDGVMTRTGCTVSNVLRYYIVFVSLLWNAVEAFNMYLMLLRVFDSRVKRFALKAGAIAWGIPLIMVAVCFTVSKTSFNGHFVIISEDKGECAFKCQLNQQMLHYAYLLPLAVIIFHNMIIFGFVLKTIIKHGQKLGQSKRRSHLVQLIGAVATLVLLGVPWVFSAFGAIDATDDERLILVQGIFQVVFVIFVNLQGCFIFTFHCARNSQVRQSWMSTVRSAITTTSTANDTGIYSNKTNEAISTNNQHDVSESVEAKNNENEESSK